MILNSLIVDDDEFSRKVLEHCAKRTDFLNLVGCYEKIADALNVINKNKIDIIFLDIEMPEMNGLEFMKTFNNTPQIIVVTGKERYAAEAFNYNVTDYIVKPVNYNRFLKAVHRAKKVSDSYHANRHTNDDVFIRVDSRIVKINSKDILYIEALSDYINIYTPNSKYVVLSTMKSVEARFSNKDFLRVHRSFIVRVDKIKAIEDNCIMIHDKIIPISRSYKTEFISKLNLL